MNTPGDLRFFERVAIRLDQPPWAAILRMIAGFSTTPAWLWLTTGRASGWTLVAFVLGVLALLRVLPAVARKLLPVDGRVRTIWFERRQLAKRFDSYQWRKLLWLGLGFALYAGMSGQRFRALSGVTLTTLLSGAAGEVIWRYRVRRIEDEAGQHESPVAAAAVPAGTGTDGRRDA